MESKLLYDLYICTFLKRSEIVEFIKQKLIINTEEISYYDLIYSEKLDNRTFLDKLRVICNNFLIDNELNNKYILIISFFYKKRYNVNIEEALYNFFLDKDKELLDIDFDFWNLISTDWELKKDGFSGIKDSNKIIEKYLNDKSCVENLSDDEILSAISTL